MWCIVNLPNGTQQAVKWDPKAIGQECLEKVILLAMGKKLEAPSVCKALGIICEMEYFGLEHWTPSQKESRTRQWINLRNRLSYDGSGGGSGIQLMLALRVKFWVPVHFILQESVRNLFYMQAKADLLEGRLWARDWPNAAKLAALLCQADGIRFNELSLTAKCPIRMRREQEQLRQQQQQLQLQQQQQQQHHHHHQQHHQGGAKPEKKEKEYVLSFKKRRLSKQKSIENIDHPPQPHAANAANSPTPSASTQAQAQTQSPSCGASTSTSASTSASASSSSSSPSNSCSLQRDCAALERSLTTSPLRIYEDFIIRPGGDLQGAPMPDEFLRQVAVEHGKLATLKMSPKSAKYWLLQEIQELPGYGEELFCGVTTNESAARCDIAVGAHGITVCTGDEKNSIPFSAIAAAKSFRRTFKLEYVDDHNDRKDLEIKLSKHAIAAGLYRSITERHAFYVCDKVRGVVTNQFTRDLKGTIASMFKEDTELGKRYVFDIQRTCREVHDQARRTLHERGIEISSAQATCGVDAIARFLPHSHSPSLEAAAAAVATSPDDAAGACGGWPAELAEVAAAADGAGGGASCSGLSLGSGCSMAGKLDLAIREKAAREAAIERCVDTRISEAMTCKICMDRAIDTMFSPCCHVMACAQCAARCSNCPNCRVRITSVVKIYLPPELRTSQSGSSGSSAGAAVDSSKGNNNSASSAAGSSDASAAASSAPAALNALATTTSATASASASASASPATTTTPKLTAAA